MKVGILGAMTVEIDGICSKLERTIVKNVAGNEYHAGQLNGVSVVIVKCGIGKVNAAVSTQAMIDHFDIDCIINTGVAGALGDSLNIFDIVISKDLVQHDFDTSGVGDQVGLVAGFKKVSFDVIEELHQLAFEVGQEIFGKETIFVGRIATGDQFVCEQHVKDKIVKTFGAVCTEMEGAAIAQTCVLNNMPFLVIRSISDNAGKNANVEYKEFEIRAAERSAQLVEQLVLRLQNVEIW